MATTEPIGAWGSAVPPGRLKRLANQAIRRQLGATEAEPVAFFCECEDVHCLRPIWLTPARYDRALAESDRQALVERHLPPEAA